MNPNFNASGSGDRGGSGTGNRYGNFEGMNQGGSGQNWRNDDNDGQRNGRNQGDDGGGGEYGFGNQNGYSGERNNYGFRPEQENKNFGFNRGGFIQGYPNRKVHGNHRGNRFEPENLSNYNGGIPQFNGFSYQPMPNPSPYNTNAGRNGTFSGQRFPSRIDRNNGGKGVSFTFQNDDYHNEHITSAGNSQRFERLLRETSENNGGFDKRKSHETSNRPQQQSGINQQFSGTPSSFRLFVEQQRGFINTNCGEGTSGIGGSHGGQNSHASSSPQLAVNSTGFESGATNQNINPTPQEFNGSINQPSVLFNQGNERNNGNWQNFQNYNNRKNQGSGNGKDPTGAPNNGEKIQNSRRRFKEEYPEFYAEQKTNRDKTIQEKREKIDQLKAEKDSHRSQWPAIRCNYEPEIWNANYTTMHNENLQLSIKMLQEIDDLSEEETKRVLMKALEKTTFVELNLIINGPQTTQKLFENLKLAMGEGQENNMPFESVENLEAFLNEMSPVFLFKKTINKYVCSGMQSRKFCQWLSERIKLGDIIKEDNFDEDYKMFKETFSHTDPALKQFADAELTLDFSSYRYLAAVVPAFRYDKENDVLSVNPAPLPWTLQLPIFGDTMHASNPLKRDLSRKVTTVVNQFCTMPNRNSFGCCVTDPLEGVRACTYRHKFSGTNESNSKEGMNKLAQIVTGFVQPNSVFSQLEVYFVEPIRIDFANNVVANGPHVDNRGSKFDVDFNTFQRVQNHADGKVMRREQT